MKKIGFIDFYLDEWHANNYPAWIKESCAANGYDMEVAYAWAETCRPGGMSTKAWCEAHGVGSLSSIEEVVEKSDCLIVLSPDNPEHHERLSALPLISGKPVYIDKTFSPDFAAGVRMFELAEKHRTPMFSSSALRYAKELSGYPDNRVNRESIEYIMAMGPGVYDNYSVHQLEMIVSLAGTGAGRVKSLSTDNGRVLVIEYANGRLASMNQMQEAPFRLSIQLKDGGGVFVDQCSDIFQRLIDNILGFFETGKSPVPREETLEIMAIREAGYKALANYDTWIKIESLA